MAIIVSGLALRGFGLRLGLPPAFVKYGGSVLWGAMVFFLVATAATNLSRRSIALISGSIAVCVELFRLARAMAGRLSADHGGRAVAWPHLLAMEFARLCRRDRFRSAVRS